MPSDERVSDHRRINKPIMEKRRRARINDSLTQLKTLVLEGMKKDPARHSKLEKADILEMAVKHLKSIQTRPEVSAARYREGYLQCRRQVAAYLSRENAVGDELRKRLLAHLSAEEAAAPAAAAVPTLSAGVGGLQLVPTSLPGGQLAFILPSPAAATVTAPTTLPLTVAVQSQIQRQQHGLQQLQLKQEQPAPTSVSSPSPVPSSPARAESGYDEPRSPASPSSSVGSCGYASFESTSQERPWSPQPLDLVAHNRGVEDTCWRPW